MLTFALWLLAEHFGFSGVITVVVFAVTMAQRTRIQFPARLRIASFAIWESVTTILNVLAFTLIGLQIRPILEPLNDAERLRYIGAGLLLLVTIIIVRIVWVMLHHRLVTWKARCSEPAGAENHPSEAVKGGLVIAWSGMRGIVTLAAAMALPAEFPYRDFIQLAAFIVVLGTLIVQGISLRPLLLWLKLPTDTTAETELQIARKAALEAGIAALPSTTTAPAGQRLRHEYAEALARNQRGQDPRNTTANALRLQSIAASRQAVEELRRSGIIGDDVYRQIEAELDWQEMSAFTPDTSAPP